MVEFSNILSAYTLLQPIIHKTPILTSRSFNNISGNNVFLKAENLQRIGSFKIRGAYNKIASLSHADRQKGVLTHSSGNHAQGVALASKLLNTQATIVMPSNSSKFKIDATRSYGAEILFCGDSSDDRERVTKQLQQERHAIIVHPYDDDDVIAGQGTVLVEISQDLRALDFLFVPIGGGGLISGCAIAARHLFPKIKIIGVETEPANDCQQSFHRKEIVRIPPPKTIADGMRTQSIGKRNFEIILRYLDDVITVTDSQVVEMMRFFFQRMKIVVEPTGAVAPAAVYYNVLKLSDKNIATVISGGNVETSFLKQWL